MTPPRGWKLGFAHAPPLPRKPGLFGHARQAYRARSILALRREKWLRKSVRFIKARRVGLALKDRARGHRLLWLAPCRHGAAPHTPTTKPVTKKTKLENSQTQMGGKAGQGPQAVGNFSCPQPTPKGRRGEGFPPFPESGFLNSGRLHNNLIGQRNPKT